MSSRLSDARCFEIVAAAHQTVDVLKSQKEMSSKQAWEHVIAQVEMWQPFSPAAKRFIKSYAQLVTGEKL